MKIPGVTLSYGPRRSAALSSRRACEFICSGLGWAAMLAYLSTHTMRPPDEERNSKSCGRDSPGVKAGRERTEASDPQMNSVKVEGISRIQAW